MQESDQETDSEFDYSIEKSRTERLYKRYKETEEKEIKESNGKVENGEGSTG